MEEWILVDEALNDYGYRVLVDGIDLVRFLKNPIMLYNHKSYSEMPIGTWTNVRKEGGKLYGTPKFSNIKEGKKVRKMVEEGTLRAASIGFNVKTLSSDPKHLIPGQTRATVTTSELYEVSIVPMGSNKNAIKLNFANKGITLSGSYAKEQLDGLIPTVEKEFEMKELFRKLGLKDDATEAEAMAALEKLETSRVELLLLLGTENGVVTDANKPTYEKLAKADFKTTLSLLSVKSVKKEVEKKETETEEKPKDGELSLHGILKELKAGASNSAASGIEDKNSFKWLSLHNPKELNRIRKEEPEKYKELAANYGK